MKIGYARVSTTDQDTALQLNALSAEGCERVLSETASGAQRDRPELKAAMDFCRKGDVLVVWKFDRLARSLSQLLATTTKLESEGIGLASITEQVDTSTPGGKLVFHLFGALAEFERGIIRERTLAGLKAAKAAGRVGGRPPSLSQKDIAVAKALLNEPTITAEETAAALGISTSTLYRYFPSARASVSYRPRSQWLAADEPNAEELARRYRGRP